MGVSKDVLQNGNGKDYPSKGDEVTIEYTGNLYDESKADNHYRGQQCNSHNRSSSACQLTGGLDSIRLLVVGTSRQRSEWAKSSKVHHFNASCEKAVLTAIGWDEGVVSMSLGEKSILTISPYVHLPQLSTDSLTSAVTVCTTLIRATLQ